MEERWRNASRAEFTSKLISSSNDRLERRNKERPNKNVFHPWGPILDRAMRETMRDVGMWLDNSALSVTETVDEILRRAWVEAVLS